MVLAGFQMAAKLARECMKLKHSSFGAVAVLKTKSKELVKSNWVA
jgi:hypothetical protein